MTVSELLHVSDSRELEKEEIMALLNVDNFSSDFYRLLDKANALSRADYHDRGYIFLQIGINSAPCSGNCKFCSMGADHYALTETGEQSIDRIQEIVESAVAQQVDAIFLMTTADFPLDAYLKIARKVKPLLPEHVMLIANVGDFDQETAQKLKDAGFSGVYHIVRLSEGIDTDISPEKRVATLDAIAAVGLDLLYCIEPIGPEHTYEQIANEILRARKYNVDIMACMRRVAVKGTPCFDRGEISDLELAKIVAVTRIAAHPGRSMNVHEPNALAMLSGVNQLYAEIGCNPRDNALDTQENRGYSIQKARDLLRQNGYH